MTLHVATGDLITLSSTGPWPNLILTPHPVREACAACPFGDDDLSSDDGVSVEGLRLLEWVPGVGLVEKS